MDTNKKVSNFSEAFKELEALTKEFEQGQISLEEGITKFERGVYLSNFCKSKLSEVEHQIHEVKHRLNETDQSS
ncbi:MAG: exodeoxyribonuclease VII small subunit [Candidatus Paceibacteria bacterium]